MLSRFLIAALSVIFVLSVTGCGKEIIRETIATRDSIIIRHDSVVYKQDVAKLMAKKWSLLSHEYETFVGNVSTSKKAENFVANGFYDDYKSNGTYTFFDLSGTNNGSWELLSENYFVLDKNTPKERYYYILSISENNLVTRGPYTKTNQLFTNFLITTYLKKP